MTIIILQGLVNLIKACQSAGRSIYARCRFENDVGLAMNQVELLRESLISPWYDEISGASDGKMGGCGLLGIEYASNNSSKW